MPNVDETLEAVHAAGIEPVTEMEERWYDVVMPSGRWSERGVMHAGNRQFVVADPDGYLLRFYMSLGSQPT